MNAAPLETTGKAHDSDGCISAFAHLEEWGYGGEVWF